MRSSRPTRRTFLHAAAAAAVCDWSALLPFSPATAAEATVTPDLVRFSPAIEPVVRLIEKTPRDQCPAMLAGQLRDGLPYRQFLAALYLANLRTGAVDHPLAVLHSVNQLVLDLPVRERLLPLFWALDAYKAQEPPAALRPLKGPLPAADAAERELHEAMETYDTDRAERAIVALARTQGAFRTVEPVWQYAARDWTFIGHLAIWAANTWRLLQTVGWEHGETALRVTVTNIMGEREGMKGQPYAANLLRVKEGAGKLPADWAEAGGNASFTDDLLSRLREQDGDAACKLAISGLLSAKAKASAVWDAVHVAGGEMLLSCQKNSEPLHANTVANALHFSFSVSERTETRLLVLLQAVGWMSLFRSNMAKKRWLRPRRITDLQGDPIPDDAAAAAELILRDASFGPGAKPSDNPIPGWKGIDYNDQPWRHAAARRAFTFATKFPDPGTLFREAGRLLPLKADWDPHRVKFPIAAFENVPWVSPRWRPHLVATASYSFLGADALDTSLTVQIREAVRTLGG